MIEYKSCAPLFLQASSVVLSLETKVKISDGCFDLTPLAVRWVLNVSISTNNQTAHLELTENMLRAFLQSQFVGNARHNMELYTQTPGGFAVVFAPGLIDNASSRCRRYLKCVDVVLNFWHEQQTVEPLLDQMTQLADYGMACFQANLVDLAPAIFTDNYAKLLAIESTFEPLEIGLRLPATFDLRRAAERECLQSDDAKLRLWQDEDRLFFSRIEYVSNVFLPVDIEPGEYDCTHENVFWDEILP